MATSTMNRTREKTVPRLSGITDREMSLLHVLSYRDTRKAPDIRHTIGRLEQMEPEARNALVKALRVHSDKPNLFIFRESARSVGFDIP